MDQLDGDDAMQPTGCEQRDAGREENLDRQNRASEESESLRVKLPQRSDMIYGFATLKGFSVYPFMSLCACVFLCVCVYLQNRSTGFSPICNPAAMIIPDTCSFVN